MGTLIFYLSLCLLCTNIVEGYKAYYCDDANLFKASNNFTITINDTESTLSSNFNDHYKEFSNCIWIIKPYPEASSIDIVFSKLDLEYAYDFVSIYSSTTLNAFTLISSYSGYEVPPSINVPYGFVVINFDADPAISGTGFELTYHANVCPSGCNKNGFCMNGTCVCAPGYTGYACNTTYCPEGPSGKCTPNGFCHHLSSDEEHCKCDAGYYGGDCEEIFCDGSWHYDLNSGTFSDHHGNGEYKSNMNCRWLIQPQDFVKGDSISLDFSQFHTIQYEYVYVYDGDHENTSLLIGAFYGDIIPPTVYSHSGSLLVIFKTDENIESLGFTAAWNLVHCDSACSGNGYCHQAGQCHCNMGFKGEICEERDCYRNCWGRGYCNVTANYTCMCGNGWEGIDCGYCYNCTGNNQYCNTMETEFTNETGIITDHIGFGDYTPNLECGFSIRAPGNKSIALRFTRVDLAEDTQIIIYDNEHGQVIGVLTGSIRDLNTLPVYTSIDNHLYVYFDADQKVKTGFTASYYFFECNDTCEHGRCNFGTCSCDPGYTGRFCNISYCPNNCNGNGNCQNTKCVCEPGFFGVDCLSTYCTGNKILSAPSGTLRDHRYGNSYASNARCLWTLNPVIASNASLPMTIVFQRFQTEELYDYVSVYDNQTQVSFLTGSYLPSPIRINSGLAYVQFFSDLIYQQSGFLMSYSLNSQCNAGLGCNNGNCINGTCICFNGYTGNLCNDLTIGQKLNYDDTIIYKNVSMYSWQLFYVDILDNYFATLEVSYDKTSIYGHPDLFARKGAPPTLNQYHASNVYWNPNRKVRVLNPTPDRYFFGIYGREGSEFRISAMFTCRSAFTKDNNTCKFIPDITTNNQLPSSSTTSPSGSVNSNLDGNGNNGHKRVVIAAVVIPIIVIIVAIGAVVAWIVARKYKPGTKTEIELPSVETKKAKTKGYKEFEDEA